MKKNNTAEKAVQDAKKLSEALKESTMKSLKDIMSEAIDNIIMSKDDEEEEVEDKDEPTDEVEDTYEVEDVETEENDEEGKEEKDGEKEAVEPEDKEGDEEGPDIEQFKVGDNEYNLTDADDDTFLDIYNKLGDDDQIFVQKDADDAEEVVDDEENGDEYEIELGDAAEEEDGEDDAEIELDLDDSEGEDEADDLIDIEIDDDEGDEIDEEKDFIVNDYQKKDAIEGLSMKDVKAGTAAKEWDKGAPKGTGRPYGKQGDGQPFDEKVNECGDVKMADEAMIDEDGSGLNTKHATKKNTNHINRNAQNQRNVSTDGEFQALRESAMKIYEKAKAIQEENKMYKNYIANIKKSLTEAAVLNVSLTNALKLMVENSTTAQEKKNILTRFNNVKTLAESKSLYNTIKAELNESKTSTPILEKQLSTVQKDTLNETKIYATNPSIDLMNRMDNLWKK